ncbi:MAG: response regulator [Acidobacteria bacterium]|nr:response regulator [Acidobacteriota bacterium]
MERPATHRWSSQEVAKIVALFDAERRFHEQMATLLPVALATVGEDGKLLAANSAFLKQFQIPASEIDSRSLEGLFQLKAPECLQRHQATVVDVSEGVLHFTPLPRWERGETEWMAVLVAGMAAAPASSDVSSSGAQVLATQRLAQVVTHEANNLVMIASGYGKEILTQLPGDSPIREDVSMLLDATKRIEAMTALLAEYGKPRKSTIGGFPLTAVAPGVSDAVAVDMGALQSAIAAAGALAGGGLKIEALRQPPNVVLVLTGFSMTPEALRQALEPLSKAAREGDATARGAALIGPLLLQAGVQWRVTDAAALEIQAPLSAAAPFVSKRSALVTDDQPGIRRLVRRVLEGMGFAVDEAGSGEEAVALLERRGEAVTLLVTDMQMDGMTGRDLADRVRYHYPSTRILFISGYTDDPGVQSGALQEGTAFLEKPFDPGQLKVAVTGLVG